MALSRTMAQKDIDTFLTEIGAADNNFTVDDLFEGRKDEVAWSRIQRVLNLDDSTNSAQASTMTSPRSRGGG